MASEDSEELGEGDGGSPTQPQHRDYDLLQVDDAAAKDGALDMRTVACMTCGGMNLARYYICAHCGSPMKKWPPPMRKPESEATAVGANPPTPPQKARKGSIFGGRSRSATKEKS